MTDVKQEKWESRQRIHYIIILVKKAVQFFRQNTIH